MVDYYSCRIHGWGGCYKMKQSTIYGNRKWYALWGISAELIFWGWLGTYIKADASVINNIAYTLGAMFLGYCGFNFGSKIARGGYGNRTTQADDNNKAGRDT